MISTPYGSAGESGTRYVNIKSELPFNRVVASNGRGAFEFDNLALNVSPQVVPLPATPWLAGLGRLGLALTRRARAHAGGVGRFAGATPVRG